MSGGNPDSSPAVSDSGRHTNSRDRHINSSGRHSNSSGRHSNSSGRHSNSSGRHSNSSGRHSNSSGRHSNSSGRRWGHETNRRSFSSSNVYLTCGGSDSGDESGSSCGRMKVTHINNKGEYSCDRRSNRGDTNRAEEGGQYKLRLYFQYVTQLSSTLSETLWEQQQTERDCLRCFFATTTPAASKAIPLRDDITDTSPSDSDDGSSSASEHHGTTPETNTSASSSETSFPLVLQAAAALVASRLSRRRSITSLGRAAKRATETTRRAATTINTSADADAGTSSTNGVSDHHRNATPPPDGAATLPAAIAQATASASAAAAEFGGVGRRQHHREQQRQQQQRAHEQLLEEQAEACSGIDIPKKGEWNGAVSAAVGSERVTSAGAVSSAGSGAAATGVTRSFVAPHSADADVSSPRPGATADGSSSRMDRCTAYSGGGRDSRDGRSGNPHRLPVARRRRRRVSAGIIADTSGGAVADNSAGAAAAAADATAAAGATAVARATGGVVGGADASSDGDVTATAGSSEREKSGKAKEQRQRQQKTTKFHLLRWKHQAFCLRHLRGDHPFDRSMLELEASRCWLLFWSIHALDLLFAFDAPAYQYSILAFLNVCFDVSSVRDGFGSGWGGGPGQQAHLAPTYAATAALVIAQVAADWVNKFVCERNISDNRGRRCVEADMKNVVSSEDEESLMSSLDDSDAANDISDSGASVLLHEEKSYSISNGSRRCHSSDIQYERNRNDSHTSTLDQISPSSPRVTVGVDGSSINEYSVTVGGGLPAVMSEGLSPTNSSSSQQPTEKLPPLHGLSVNSSRAGATADGKTTPVGMDNRNRMCTGRHNTKKAFSTETWRVESFIMKRAPPSQTAASDNVSDVVESAMSARESCSIEGVSAESDEETLRPPDAAVSVVRGETRQDRDDGDVRSTPAEERRGLHSSMRKSRRSSIARNTQTEHAGATAEAAAATPAAGAATTVQGSQHGASGEEKEKEKEEEKEGRSLSSQQRPATLALWEEATCRKTGATEGNVSMGTTTGELLINNERERVTERLKAAAATAQPAIAAAATTPAIVAAAAAAQPATAEEAAAAAAARAAVGRSALGYAGPASLHHSSREDGQQEMMVDMEKGVGAEHTRGSAVAVNNNTLSTTVNEGREGSRQIQMEAVAGERSSVFRSDGGFSRESEVAEVRPSVPQGSCEDCHEGMREANDPAGSMESVYVALSETEGQAELGTKQPLVSEWSTEGSHHETNDLDHIEENNTGCIDTLLLPPPPHKEDPRQFLYDWMLQLKTPEGGFCMHVGGEADMRGTYCAVATASMLHMLTEELLMGVPEYVASCQTLEGGIAGEPDLEAHGGYTYCGLAALCIAGRADVLDLNRMLKWTVLRQQGFEGGFQGRTNKLVDSCYSFWQGAVVALLLESLRQTGQAPPPTHGDAWISVKHLLLYILACSQVPMGGGGLRDKPGKQPDLYHTCYALSGLSVAKHHLLLDKQKKKKLTQCKTVCRVAGNGPRRHRHRSSSGGDEREKKGSGHNSSTDCKSLYRGNNGSSKKGCNSKRGWNSGSTGGDNSSRRDCSSRRRVSISSRHSNNSRNRIGSNSSSEDENSGSIVYNTRSSCVTRRNKARKTNSSSRQQEEVESRAGAVRARITHDGKNKGTTVYMNTRDDIRAPRRTGNHSCSDSTDNSEDRGHRSVRTKTTEGGSKTVSPERGADGERKCARIPSAMRGTSPTLALSSLDSPSSGGVCVSPSPPTTCRFSSMLSRSPSPLISLRDHGFRKRFSLVRHTENETRERFASPYAEEQKALPVTLQSPPSRCDRGGSDVGGSSSGGKGAACPASFSPDDPSSECYSPFSSSSSSSLSSDDGAAVDADQAEDRIMEIASCPIGVVDFFYNVRIERVLSNRLRFSSEVPVFVEKRTGARGAEGAGVRRFYEERGMHIAWLLQRSLEEERRIS